MTAPGEQRAWISLISVWWRSKLSTSGRGGSGGRGTTTAHNYSGRRYCRFVAADEEATLAAQRSHRDELIQPLLDEDSHLDNIPYKIGCF